MVPLGVYYSIGNHLIVQVSQASGNLVRAKVAAEKLLAEPSTTFRRPNPSTVADLVFCGLVSEVVSCHVVALLGLEALSRKLSSFFRPLKERGDVVTEAVRYDIWQDIVESLPHSFRIPV